MASNHSEGRHQFTAEEVIELCVQVSNEAGSDFDSEHEGMCSSEESDLDKELLGNDIEEEHSDNDELSDYSLPEASSSVEGSASPPKRVCEIHTGEMHLTVITRALKEVPVR